MAPIQALVPRGEDIADFKPWMAVVIVVSVLAFTVAIDAVFGRPLAKFFKNCFLFCIWYPLHVLVHKLFPEQYGRYGLKCAAKNRDAGKFTGKGCPRHVRCLPARSAEDRLAQIGPQPPSPSDIALPESPVASEPPRGRSRTRAPATGSRTDILPPRPSPDGRIAPRRENSLRAEQIELTVDGNYTIASYHVRLEAAVIQKKTALDITAAKDAADLADKMYLKAQKCGASEQDLAKAAALRQLAADQISWSVWEHIVVSTETHIMNLKRTPACPQRQISEASRRRREELRAYAEELRVAAAVARAPLDSA